MVSMFKAFRTMIVLALIFSLFFPAAYAQASEGKEDPNAPQYFRLDPDIVTNLRENQNPKTFLQIQIEIMVKGTEAANKIKYHAPIIRDHLITLFSSKTRAQLESVEERKIIRAEALKIIQDKMIELEGQPLAEEILFTQIAIQ